MLNSGLNCFFQSLGNCQKRYVSYPMEKWFLDQMVRNVGLVEKTFWPFAYDVPIPGYKTKTTGQQKPLQQILICLHITLASIPRQQKLYLTLSFPSIHIVLFPSPSNGTRFATCFILEMSQMKERLFV